MPITADILYPRLLEATGSTPIGLEKRIGLGNGVIAKAINNKSALRAGTLALINRAFPELNPDFLENGRLPLFVYSDSNGESNRGNATQGTTAAEPGLSYSGKSAEGWKEKYLALLERQLHDQDLLLKTATAAIEAAQATISFIHSMPAQLSGLRQFSLRQFALLSKRPLADLEAELRGDEEPSAAPAP